MLRETRKEDNMPKCQVCNGPVRPWGPEGRLAGCHRTIAVRDGKVLTLYFGAVHRKCDRVDWPRRIEEARLAGWLVPNPNGRGYVPAPAYS